MSAPPAWTEREDARLRSLAAGGMTGTEIARALGRSKSGCIGRLHRLGGKLSRPSPFPARNAAKPKPPSPQVSPPPANESVVVTTLGQLPPAVPATAQPVALSHARTCQWVERLGYPPRFCDAPVWQHTSWCERHHRICYVRGSARVPGA